VAERGSYGQTPPTFPADELGALSPGQTCLTRRPSLIAPHATFGPGSLQRDAFPSSSQHVGPSSPSGGRFATFPVKGRRQDSFAPAIAEPQDSSQPASTFTEEVKQALLDDADEPAPMYEISEGAHASPLAPPPGAALPVAPRARLYGSPDSGAYDGLVSLCPVKWRRRGRRRPVAVYGPASGRASERKEGTVWLAAPSRCHVRGCISSNLVGLPLYPLNTARSPIMHKYPNKEAGHLCRQKLQSPKTISRPHPMP
jgi:hypothetical protein